MNTILEGPFRAHALGICNWFTKHLWTKYTAGQREHGGEIWTKGGMLLESQNEVIDLSVYLYTLREQLQLVEEWLEHGKTENALIAIGHILRGTPLDRLPQD
jgi:hypothetical protein